MLQRLGRHCLNSAGTGEVLERRRWEVFLGRAGLVDVLTWGGRWCWDAASKASSPGGTALIWAMRLPSQFRGRRSEEPIVKARASPSVRHPCAREALGPPVLRWIQSRPIGLPVLMKGRIAPYVAHKVATGCVVNMPLPFRRNRLFSTALRGSQSLGWETLL